MNYFLTYIEDHGSKMSESAKARLTGEVHFLRAWSYFLLIQRYSGVPLISKPHSLDDDFTVERSDFDTCVDFILDDLQQAYELLPAKADAAKGRINKDVVLALRSRLTLVAASKLFNDPDKPQGGIFRGTYSRDKWQRAFDAAKAIVDRAEVDGAYSLDDTYDGIWKDVNSPELIWAKYFVATSDADDNYTKKAQLLYTVEYYNGWESFHPTQAAQIDFEMKNGKKWFEEGSGYDANHPYKNRDPRFYYCIAAPFYPYGSTDKNGSYSEAPLLLYYLYDGMTRKDFEAGTPEPAYTSKAKHTTSGNHGGLELYKWYLPTEYISESQTGSKLYPWFRLAEMYLNYAEAAYMLGKEDICREYINKIRQRPDVMMPEVTESGSDLWDRLVNERRVELYAEMFRYFDIPRRPPVRSRQEQHQLLLDQYGRQQVLCLFRLQGGSPLRQAHRVHRHLQVAGQGIHHRLRRLCPEPESYPAVFPGGRPQLPDADSPQRDHQERGQAPAEPRLSRKRVIYETAIDPVGSAACRRLQWRRQADLQLQLRRHFHDGGGARGAGRFRGPQRAV